MSLLETIGDEGCDTAALVGKLPPLIAEATGGTAQSRQKVADVVGRPAFRDEIYKALAISPPTSRTF